MHLRFLPHILRPASLSLGLAWLVLGAGCDRDSASSVDGVGAAPDEAIAAPALPDPVPGPDGKVRLTEAEWRARLTPEQYHILRGAATERPFSCPLWKITDTPGVYRCAGCGLALFNSADKFDSGTGWPSFIHPITPDRILEKEDTTHGMVRIETVCARCDGHLGHVFSDGPPPTGLRYCINGAVLRFEPADNASKSQP